ncbi:4'-phosphopantetheinyl transferase family protein [Xanthovirga aplysinae]|uniref:4'-phosphopantetheinyl transferase family protein n=1 Tax=Xanthovirga aplysinae TaxID=2529853 RepID=UPI0012BC1C00|nr:4'-phosphopantetheinyl transferase superfamily protein [Xanthovirga aplysinae]MTI33364.1 4'-phosphopantetheinyl transferase superfamily protein [Xanthovirga aplysinae]
MTVAKLEKLNGNSSWCLWEINESETDLFNALPAYDQKVFQKLNISHSGRRLEWLAARNSIKQLAESLGIAYKGVIKDEHGKPLLKDQSLHVGITHSFPFAAGVIHRTKAVGIDIEKVQEKLLRLGSRFLKDSELQDADFILEKLCVYWTAKETLYKIHGKKRLAFKENLHIEPFHLAKKGTLKGIIEQNENKNHHQILYIKFNNFYISIGS